MIEVIQLLFWNRISFMGWLPLLEFLVEDGSVFTFIVDHKLEFLGEFGLTGNYVAVILFGLSDELVELEFHFLGLGETVLKFFDVVVGELGDGDLTFDLLLQIVYIVGLKFILH